MSAWPNNLSARVARTDFRWRMRRAFRAGKKFPQQTATKPQASALRRTGATTAEKIL
jgi:hypothetical protein